MGRPLQHSTFFLLSAFHNDNQSNLCAHSLTTSLPYKSVMVGTLVALVTAVSSAPIQHQLHSRHTANICWMNKYMNKLMHLLQWVDFNLLWNKNLEYQIWAACKYMLKYIVLNVTPSVVTSLLAVHNLCEAWHSQPVLHGGVGGKKAKGGAKWLGRCSPSAVLVLWGDLRLSEKLPRTELKVARRSGYTKNLAQKQLWGKTPAPEVAPLVGTHWHFRCKHKNRWETRRGHPTHPAAASAFLIALFAGFRLFSWQFGIVDK